MKRTAKMTDYLGTEPLRSQTDAARLIWLWLLEHDRITISLRDLAEVLAVTPRTVNVSILALESAGLLVRQADTVEGKGGQTFLLHGKIAKNGASMTQEHLHDLEIDGFQYRAYIVLGKQSYVELRPLNEDGIEVGWGHASSLLDDHEYDYYEGDVLFQKAVDTAKEIATQIGAAFVARTWTEGVLERMTTNHEDTETGVIT